MNLITVQEPGVTNSLNLRYMPMTGKTTGGGPDMEEHVWRRALLRSDMPREAKLVGVTMSLYGDYDTGTNVRPSNGLIAQHLSYGGKTPEQRVNRLVSKLREAGWLTKTGKIPDGPVIYRLSIPEEGMSQTTYNIPNSSTRGPSAPSSNDSPNIQNSNKAGLEPAISRGRAKKKLNSLGSDYVSIMPNNYDYGAVTERPRQQEEAPF
ncbi:hypothetical protein ACH427_25110 [Streptomyces sp. NPDC020379]|uniref:hypothetical protein n=1 Tax=Streptomyces sp. NPDC020379 TaxID=3365071 RepID=UPI0037ADE6AB